jgi:hypothetical protein
MRCPKGFLFVRVGIAERDMSYVGPCHGGGVRRRRASCAGIRNDVHSVVRDKIMTRYVACNNRRREGDRFFVLLVRSPKMEICTSRVPGPPISLALSLFRSSRDEGKVFALLIRSSKEMFALVPGARSNHDYRHIAYRDTEEEKGWMDMCTLLFSKLNKGWRRAHSKVRRALHLASSPGHPSHLVCAHIGRGNKR